MNVSSIMKAYTRQKQSDLNFRTNLQRSIKLSEKYQANVCLKREDQQIVRIFKMRGVYNKFMTLTDDDKKVPILCPSDGNHAQAFAYFCHYFKVKGIVFVPEVVFGWKRTLIEKYGREYVEVKLHGINYAEVEKYAINYQKQNGGVLFHPYEDEAINEGNGVIGVEILEQAKQKVDYLFLPIGGGGLAAGIITYFQQMSPNTQIIGVQAEKGDTMLKLLKGEQKLEQNQVSRFCDGSTLGDVPKLNFKIIKDSKTDIVSVTEVKISTTILNLYEEGIPVEPSGALSVAGLEKYKDEIKGKNVVCIVSGASVDLSRFDEFKELSLLEEGLKYFFLVQMPYKPGILKQFVLKCLGPDDEISHLQFQQKLTRERGPAIVGIELGKKENIEDIVRNMQEMKLKFENINKSQELYDLFI